jgi:hypothetical protein
MSFHYTQLFLALPHSVAVNHNSQDQQGKHDEDYADHKHDTVAVGLTGHTDSKTGSEACVKPVTHSSTAATSSCKNGSSVGL